MSVALNRPESLSDLDRFLYARGKNRRKAHLPGGDGSPLCVRADAFGVDWREGVTEHYPNPDEWFTLCERCLERI